jgi:tRNA(adenine34) deaminase
MRGIGWSGCLWQFVRAVRQIQARRQTARGRLKGTVNDASQPQAKVDLEAVDRHMMARCIELSKIGAAAGELPFGSLIARGGEIIADATNEIMRLVDESRHAEILAIARARQLIGDDALTDCTLYTTVEPCPMCSFCIRAAGVGRVVFALGSPKMGGLSQWNILGHDRLPLLFGPAPELVSGILADEAHKVWVELNPVIGRAVVWLGYLTKPKPKAAAYAGRSRYRYSLRRFIALFLRQRTGKAATTESDAERGPAVP